MDQDNGPRENQTMEALAKLKPFFEPNTGTVTAGNSSQVTDGAAALLLMTERALKESGLTPLGRLEGYAYAGLDPSRMGLGPVYAIHRAEQKTGLSLKDADIIEINEAFAAQVIACQKAAKLETYSRKHLQRESALGEIPDEILNVNGGGIALGHPVGVTGSRLGTNRAQRTTPTKCQSRAGLAMRRRRARWRALVKPELRGGLLP